MIGPRGARRSTWRRAHVSGIGAAVRKLLALILMVSACDDPDACPDGVVVGGTCEGRCDPAECLPGNTCVDNRCTLECTSHLDCGAGKACFAAGADDGSAVQICRVAEAITPCPNGDECGAPLVCMSAGPGDALAYCTKIDCTADAECAPGLWCGARTTGGALQRLCLKRAPCAPCATDLDCSLELGMRCASLGDAHVCARTCGDGDDCRTFEACEAGACVPRFGACSGSGAFCEPCVDERDCGDLGDTVRCGSQPSGERACFDTSMPDTCTTSDDCPASPSGLHGVCIDEVLGVSPGDDNYHRCYWPYHEDRSAFSCW
jgi:hypothetical protein